MRFSPISINLLKIFRIISFVFDLKYLSQNSINFNMLGVFWNLQDEQISKLSLNLYLEQHLKEILRFFTAAGAVCHHCIYFLHHTLKCTLRSWWYKISLVEFLLLLEHNEIFWLIFDTKKLFQAVNLVTYLKIWISYKAEGRYWQLRNDN